MFLWGALALLPIVNIDLDSDAFRQTVVDLEPGQYLGHPTTVLLEDGRTIIAVYPRGHGAGQILMKRSVDGGKTWSERLPVPENWSTSQETPTIHRTIDPKSKRKRLILWSGLNPARLSVSEDDGIRWTPLQAAGTWGGIVVMSSIERLADGRYLGFFHDDGRFLHSRGKASGSMTLYQTESRDGGRTWDYPQALWSNDAVHLCEPGSVWSPDRKELTLMLRENRRARNSHRMSTQDSGKTWSWPIELPSALTGDRHVAKYGKDGRLVVVFRDMAEGPTKGDWVAWVGTYEDIVNGREGQYRVRLKDNHDGDDCGYSGLELLPDGTFVATTYGHWEPGKPPYILSVRFKLEELDARAASKR